MWSEDDYFGSWADVGPDVAFRQVPENEGPGLKFAEKQKKQLLIGVTWGSKKGRVRLVHSGHEGMCHVPSLDKGPTATKFGQGPYRNKGRLRGDLKKAEFVWSNSGHEGMCATKSPSRFE